jgi:hypothetical protein
MNKHSRLFAKSGYRVALISRGPDYLNKLATELNQAGGEVLYLTLYSYPVMLTSSFGAGCNISSQRLHPRIY